MRTTHVVLYAHLQRAETGGLSLLVPQVPKFPKLPEGFSISVSGGERKFIVLVKGDDVAIAMGPLLSGGFYYHKDILAASRELFPGYTISGGGSVSFELWGDGWRAEFSGSSGDFGVFDPCVLAASVRTIIAEEMKCAVSFKWSN